MNTLNDRLYGTVMKNNMCEQIVEFDKQLKSAKTISNLNELYNKITFGDLNNTVASILLEVLDLKAENLKLKGFDSNN